MKTLTFIEITTLIIILILVLITQILPQQQLIENLTNKECQNKCQNTTTQYHSKILKKCICIKNKTITKWISD